MTVMQLTRFVVERESVRVRRALEPHNPPWTLDPILQQYRFCNVRREDDRVTWWIREVWRTPHREDQNLWFGMVIARFINEPDCLLEIGWPAPWNRKHFVSVLERRKKEKKRITNPAYMISTNGRSCDKEIFLADLFDDLWGARAILRPRLSDSLNSYHMTLMTRQGLGSFLAAQVIADLKYECPYLRVAPDWHSFAASGPGSRRGLNRVLERPVDSPWREEDWRMALDRVRAELNDALRWDEPLHGQDVQNCLCEYDKYERTRLGEGRPKQKFDGGPR